MTHLVYIRGLTRNSFRVLNPATGGQQSVNKTGTVQVDLDDQRTQHILSGERWHFIRVSGAGVSTATICGLTRYGFRIKNSTTGLKNLVKLGAAPTTVDLTDPGVLRVLQRNAGRYIVTATPADVAVYGIEHIQNGFEIAAGTAAAASATLTATANPADGDTVTINDKTYRFKNTLALANDVKIGASGDATLVSLGKAVNQNGVVGTDYFTGTSAPTGVTAGTEGSLAITFTASTPGIAGNAFPSTESSAVLSFPHTTFTGGDSGVGDISSNTPTKVYRGQSVNVDSTQAFNYQSLRRQFRRWIEA